MFGLKKIKEDIRDLQTRIAVLTAYQEEFLAAQCKASPTVVNPPYDCTLLHKKLLDLTFDEYL